MSQPTDMPRANTAMIWSRRFGRLAVLCVLFLGLIWAIGAIAYLPMVPTLIARTCGLVVLVFLVRSYVRCKEVRGWWMVAASIFVMLIGAVVQLIKPSNDRRWDSSQSKIPAIEIREESVRIRNFRQCEYRSENDFDARFFDFEFRIDQLESVWFVVQKFSSFEGMAHTFLSFGIRDGDQVQYFCVSVEVRREIGEVYSPLAGIYRHYELMYVIGDERDIIGVRTVMRPHDRVHMYRVNASPSQTQRLFRHIANRVNQIGLHPEFYHTLTNNCTNAIVTHTNAITPVAIDWLAPSIVLPGFSDSMAFEHGLIGSPEFNFEELKSQSQIDQLAREEGITATFSEALRRDAK